jgi:hypothetical protein
MMEAVYSGYTIFFASRCDFTRSDTFFNYAQGQAFIDGRQNGWMGLDLFKPEYSTKVDFLRQCGRLRMATRPFLLYGRLLGPVMPENAVPTFHDDAFGGDRHPGNVPAAEGRLWQDENGHLAVFLANYRSEPVEFKYRIDPAQYGLAGMRFELKQITPEGVTSISTVTDPVERTETLGPGEIRVVEISLAQGESTHSAPAR